MLIDFGSIGKLARTFQITVAGVQPGDQILASPSLDMPAGVAADELEMDMLSCAAAVIATDTVRLTVASLGGPVSGTRNINLSIG